MRKLLGKELCVFEENETPTCSESDHCFKHIKVGDKGECWLETVSLAQLNLTIHSNLSATTRFQSQKLKENYIIDSNCIDLGHLV
jgi:hypothetical protein